MSFTDDGGSKGISPPTISQSAAARIGTISLEEDYFAPSQIHEPNTRTGDPLQRPASTELPASLALPLSRTRSSTPQTPVQLRAAPSISVDDDTVSVRSFVPAVTAGDDLEAMLSEMLGSDSRWRMEQEEDIDVWEGQSEGDSISDVDSLSGPEDAGESS